MRQAEQERQDTSRDYAETGFVGDGRLFRNSTIRVSFWLVLAVAYLGSALTQPPGIYDEGIIVAGAERILHGQLPYRDFNTGYPPGQFYTIAGVFSVFGSSLLAERIWDTLWRLAILGMAIVLARAATSRRQPHLLLPLICIGLVTGNSSGHLSCMMSGVLPSLVAVWCAVVYLNQRAVRWLFFSGIAAGVAALYRHDLAACVCGAVIVASCYQAMAEGKWRWVQIAAVFSVGVLPIVTVPILYFWLSVPHDALVQSFIDFPRIINPGRRLPLPGPWSLFAWSDFYLPLTIMVTGAITLRQATASRRPTLLLLLIAGLSTLLLATQRLDTGHAYPAIVFSMVLLCACIPEWQVQNRNLLRNLLTSGAVLCYGVLSLFFWILQMTGPKHVPSGIAPAEVRYSRNEPPNEILRAGPIPLAFDERQAIGYIQRHLLPGRPLYVGVTAQGLGWYNDALFYFLADRPNATRFDMFAPALTTSAAVESEILREIREKQTEYVVLLRLNPSHEPNLSSVDSGVTILDDAIRKDYIQVGEFGRYTIWHRKDL